MHPLYQTQHKYGAEPKSVDYRIRDASGQNLGVSDPQNPAVEVLRQRRDCLHFHYIEILPRTESVVFPDGP